VGGLTVEAADILADPLQLGDGREAVGADLDVRGLAGEVPQPPLDPVDLGESLLAGDVDADPLVPQLRQLGADAVDGAVDVVESAPSFTSGRDRNAASRRALMAVPNRPP
jgi:hypothetical protein